VEVAGSTASTVLTHYVVDAGREFGTQLRSRKINRNKYDCSGNVWPGVV
jgi:hypothetical protein